MNNNLNTTTTTSTTNTINENNLEENLENLRHPIVLYFHQIIQRKEWKMEFSSSIASSLISSTKRKYLIGGVCSSEDVKLYFKKENSNRIIYYGSAFKPNIDILLQNSTPSSFGLGENLVYDENIRNGKEINSQSLEVEIGKRYFDEIKKKIKDKLFPKASNINLKFHKLAIYEPGGHFQNHRDTATSHNHHGTLLIEVKSTHTGGDLVLEHNGMQNRWSLEIDQDPLIFNLEENVRYIAFFTDINHRVEPVTTGIRMTLQYNIFVEGNVQFLYEFEDDEDEIEVENEYCTRPLFEHTRRFYGVINDDLTSSLLRNLSSLITITNSVSFPLFHLYTSAKVVPSSEII